MTLPTLVQILILLMAMTASGGVGFWLAREKYRQDREQLRDRLQSAEADKVRAIIAADRDRKRADAWRPKREAEPI